MENNRIDKKTIFLIVYLASKVSDLYIIKLLKLLYIIDETSVKESGVPVTDLDYNVWQHGPVNTDIYNELNFNQDTDLLNYISIRSSQFGSIITSDNEFQDDEFSDYELELIDKIIAEYGKLSSKQLINILHQQGSLWDKIVKEKGLESIFRYEETNTSPYKIDFKEIVQDSPLKKGIYQSAKESLKFQKHLETFA